MADLAGELEKQGIQNIQEIIRNPSYDQLFEAETSSDLEGFAKGVVTKLGAVSVDTGRFTGRSPKDKYIVKNEASEENIWWAEEGNGSDNKPISNEAWVHLKDLSQ